MSWEDRVIQVECWLVPFLYRGPDELRLRILASPCLAAFSDLVKDAL